MNIPFLSYKSIVAKPLSSFLSWLLLSFGVGVVVLILLTSGQLKDEISKNAQGIDLVVGAKGSPLQLILSAIFQVDFPTGNIDLKQAQQLARNRYIEAAIPLSLGDSYKSYRIVGTTQAYAELYGARLGAGDWFTGSMEAVAGAQAAKALELKPGSTFESQHGLSGDGEAHGHPFTVKGIMAPTNTVLDRLLLVNLASVWEVHAHDEEHHGHEADSLVHLEKLGVTVTEEQLEAEQITAMLVKYRSPMAAVMLPRIVNEMNNLQAASPAYETSRLFNLIGTGVRVANLLGVIIIVISAISVFIALLNSLKERRYEIAIMRSMGATRGQVFMHILIEGLIITLAGAVSGVVIAHLLVGILFQSVQGFSTETVYFVPEEWLVLAGCLVIGIVSSVIPAVLAYKTDISETLAKG